MDNKIKPSMFYGADAIIFENAKKLRDNMTEAEKLLWAKLSKNQLGVRFKPQHPIANYIADFYCHHAKLVIEVDGGIHMVNEIQEKDKLRTEDLVQLDLKVIRFTNDEVMKDMPTVLSTIKIALNELLPSSPRRGEDLGVDL